MAGLAYAEIRGCYGRARITLEVNDMTWKWVSEFREFALKGNVVDLAVGVIIGAAFNNVTTSLVKDIVMPPVGTLVGRMDFSNLYIPLYKMPSAQEWPKTLAD